MLAREYASLGNEVRMYTFERQYPRLLFPGGEQTTDFSGFKDIPVERVFTPYLPWTWNKAVKRLNGFAADLVIVSYFLPWFAPSYAWICRRLKATRIVALAHNIDFHEKWPGADMLSKRFFRQCQKIVVLSDACLSDLNRKMPEYISSRGVKGFHPIYDCYGSPAPVVPDARQTETTLLFFGLIKAYKGLDVLLKALKQARLSLPELKLIVAGEVYGKKDRYLDLIRELGLEGAVELHLSYVMDSEIPYFFRRSQACVLPYKSATQSGVIATSYSFNVPVIASDVGGLSEYISEGETGLLVPPNDPSALAEAIVRYFHENLRGRMSANIPAFMERFSWRRLADIILDA
jgi:glycosyltransferase involved in cell wall biosynthesis